MVATTTTERLRAALNDADKANARRHHTHPQMAEREKEIPSNPIVEELGENRGS